VSARELVIVALAGAAPALPPGWPIVVRRVVAASAFGSPHELAAAADLEHANVLWLPPWAALTPVVVASVGAWLALPEPEGGNPRVAHAALRLCCGSTSISFGRRHLVLSSPGAVDLVGDAPRPRAASRGSELDDVWEAGLPDDLASHLEAVNVQSSTAARLRHAAGELTTWRALTVTPLALLARSMAGVHGSRREALPRVVIEAYRDVLVAAKLWELAHGPAVA